MSECDVVKAAIMAVAIVGASFPLATPRFSAQAGVRAEACRLDKQGTFGDHFRPLRPTDRPAPVLSDLLPLPRESRVLVEVLAHLAPFASGALRPHV